MHIYITGASGRNGSLTLQAALDNGHSITALVRDPSSISPHPRLTVVQGTPLSESDVRRAVETPHAPDAVIFTLRPRHVSDSPLSALHPDTPADFLPSATRILVRVLTTVSPSPPKLILNSTIGVGESWSAMAAPVRLLFRYTAARQIVQDHDAVDAVVRGSGIPFVLARACRLVDGPPSAVKALPDNGRGVSWNPTLTRQSLARWLVEAAEKNTWTGASPVLIN